MNVLMGFLYVLLAIVVLLFMVLVHELGHYIAGKILKFKIEEFSIGFGKALFSHTSKKGEKFSIRIFPLGGYCAFKGEGDDEEHPDKEAYNAQKPWKRIIVFLAGVTMNFLTAVVFSLILLCTVGYDIKVVTNNQITVNGPNNEQISYTSTLQNGDVVLSVDGTKVDFAFGEQFADLVAKQQQKAKQWVENGGNIDDFSIKMVVRRNGKDEEISAKMFEVVEYKEDGQTIASQKYLLGINYSNYVFSFAEALGRCWVMAFGLAWIVLKSLWLLITFQLDFSAIGGPISTITTIASYSQMSLLNLLILIPAISANLAVFNLLPIPAMDKGKANQAQFGKQNSLHRPVRAVCFCDNS